LLTACFATAKRAALGVVRELGTNLIQISPFVLLCMIACLGVSFNMACNPSGTAFMQAQDLSRIIEMAWEDRTPFEAIEHLYGLNESAVMCY
jgi:hypothetical protein